MQSTIKKMENVKHNAKQLRINYIRETNVKKSTKILKRWKVQVEKMHKLQQKIIDFYLPKQNENETCINSLYEILPSNRKHNIFEQNISFI